MSVLRSRDNARVKRWRRLAEDASFRRRERSALIEGPHLVEAARAAGVPIKALIVAEGVKGGTDAVVLSESVFRSVVDAETPQGIAAEIAIPSTGERVGNRVYLEGVQDPGNVGAIIRTAAAFGLGTLCFDKGCADPWSPKTLRAGMGGHFALAIREGHPRDFDGKLVCTVAKGGTPLDTADLSAPLAWVFGSEGKGVSAEIQRRAALCVTIPISPGVESLNVAAAAAICFHATHRSNTSHD